MERVFVDLKDYIMRVRNQSYFKPEGQCIVENHASNSVVRAIQSQNKYKDMLHPITYHLRKFSLPEINYKMHNKDLLGVVDWIKI
jgi:hypothetical protein